MLFEKYSFDTGLSEEDLAKIRAEAEAEVAESFRKTRERFEATKKKAALFEFQADVEDARLEVELVITKIELEKAKAKSAEREPPTDMLRLRLIQNRRALSEAEKRRNAL